ncbi:radical SAM domain-containing protein [Methanocaldococcus villosus KIN24-T80]|uniref:Radical SAM domain-containing protein n=1 Tax=Methanocaldococcus villosus KIN24-T80 TaxID=1069083 RepID=N6VZY2_9EURY|nr:archaeosine biosynthesis radical SAM protein RaSEA [Methanocaldococcus villosus]ENN96647.1 radical SAM domain-containing protein [Methanocaldococcus villosus KIN24-T80]
MKPIAVWLKDEIYHDFSIGKCLVIILKTIGCSYNRCIFCSYKEDASKDIKEEEIIGQFDHALKKYNLEELDSFSVKIFTSGSFLDDREVSKRVRRYIYERLSQYKNLKEFSIESRAEYITEDKLDEMRKYLSCHIDIGLGIETFNEELRELLNKGLKCEDIVKAIRIAKKYDVGIKAYLLIKPPFLTERDAIKDAISSAKKAFELGCSRISFCPITIHKNTVLEYLWKKGQYRPPFLWSVLEIIRSVKEHYPKKIIVCDTTAFGLKRGAHNIIGCGCNKIIKENIEKFNLYQTLDLLDVECECKKVYESYIIAENKNIVPFIQECDLLEP